MRKQTSCFNTTYGNILEPGLVWSAWKNKQKNRAP